MNIKKTPLVLSMAVVAALSGNSHAIDLIPLGNNFTISLNDSGLKTVAKKTKYISGSEYLFIKYIDQKNRIITKTFDSAGNIIDPTKIPQQVTSLISDNLQKVLNNRRSKINIYPSATLRVNIALKEKFVEILQNPQSGKADIFGVEATAYMDGRALSKKDLLLLENKKFEWLSNNRTKRTQSRQETLSYLAKHNGWTTRKEVQSALKKGSASLTIALTRKQIDYLVSRSAKYIAGVEVYVASKDTISGAMLDTRINPYALNYNGRTGGNIGIYMTESGCQPSSFITNYIRLGGSATDHSANVSTIMSAVSPDSYIYCRGGAILPSSSDLSGTTGHPRVYIVNRSNGGGDSDDYTTTDRDWDNLVYDDAIATYIADGNNGTLNGHAIFPAKGFNVTSVGNYNDSNDTISSTSSFKDPETGAEKPELSAPGTSINAGGFIKSGTSMAAPHAAAFTADLMSAYGWLKLKPYYAKALMLAGAIKPISGGIEKVGLGGLDFYSAYYNGTNSWWEGSNSAFSYFDSKDSTPNNGYIERKVYLKSSYNSVRVALSWLNRGAYTYSHRSDAHPIGMDMDMRIYDPAGNYVTGSYSWDNPFEKITFNPAITGYYTIKINRYANRDTSSKFHMGLSVNW